MIKRILSLAIAFLLFLASVSCDEEKTFGHAELTLGLSDDFREFEAESFDAAYTDGTALVGIYRISYNAGFNQGIPDFLTPEQFALLYAKSTGREVEIKKHDGVPYYEYTEENDGIKSVYIASFYRSMYAYFTVLFATPESLYDEVKPRLLSYTETVIFVY